MYIVYNKILQFKNIIINLINKNVYTKYLGSCK